MIDAQFALPATYLEPLAEQMQADDGIDPLAGDKWFNAIATMRSGILRSMHRTSSVNASHGALVQITTMSDGMFGNRAYDASGKLWYFGPLHYYDMLLRNSSRKTTVTFYWKFPFTRAWGTT